MPSDYPELLEICFENREADIGRFLRRHFSGVDGPVVETLLGTGNAEPIKRLRERLIAVNEKGVDAFEAAVDKRDLASEFQRVQEALTMRVGLVLEPAKPDELATKEFMNKISASNPQFTGWPPWLDSRGFTKVADKAYVLDGVWQALIVALDGGWYQHFDFLRFDPTGEFYLHRVMQDDLSEKVNPGIAMDVILMIYRVAEVLAVGVSMARNLGWDPNGTAGFAFQWTGLNGRELSSWVNPFRWAGGSQRLCLVASQVAAQGHGSRRSNAHVLRVIRSRVWIKRPVSAAVQSVGPAGLRQAGRSDRPMLEPRQAWGQAKVLPLDRGRSVLNFGSRKGRGYDVRPKGGGEGGGRDSGVPAGSD